MNNNYRLVIGGILLDLSIHSAYSGYLGYAIVTFLLGSTNVYFGWMKEKPYDITETKD